ISDWPVKETGMEGKTGVDWCIERVLLHDRDYWLRHHYFPVSEHLFAFKHTVQRRTHENPGLDGAVHP
ncbi:hypothetical protein ACLRGI_07270, partial [Paenarthrobacter nitroguajacolicus]